MLQDHHIALVETVYESSMLKLRNFYKVGVMVIEMGRGVVDGCGHVDGK